MSTQSENTSNSRSDRRNLVSAVVASTVGTTIEWYDFFLYGSAAAIVFPKLFFPADMDPYLSLILSLGTYTIGFIARPLGGVIFGHLGDRRGRKAALVATLLLMGISTMLVGFVPSYDAIGPVAPLSLVFLRILQGIGVGGEWGGAVLLALEFGHRGKRGFYASFPQAGVPLGLLLSTGMLTVMNSLLPDEAFLSWGWRVPFYLSALLIVAGLLIRLLVMESPLFTRLKEQKQVAQAPVVEVIREHWREILLAAGARISENASFYLFSVYSLIYVSEELHMEKSVVLNGVNIAAAVAVFTIPVFGILSDFWSRKVLYITGNMFLMVTAVPYFALLGTRSPIGIVVATVMVLSFGHAILYSVQASLIPELFATRLRYTGASISYQLAGPVAGGLAPIIAATLVKYFPGTYWPLAAYVIGICIISSVCVLLLSETSQKDISE